MSRFASRSWAVVMMLLFLPALASAQAALTGVAKDDSGGVLPGVTVEASSPALIEKVRTGVTDSTGQYRIVTLPPGIYSVTFSLTGFSSVRRDGIELSGTFVATVNAEMKVGAVQETITVTGESPIVDVQSTKQQRVIDKDVIAAIPTARSAMALQVLIPGIAPTRGVDVGGASGPFGGGGDTGAIHGGRTADSRTLHDGLTTNSYGGNGGGQNLPNVAGAQEVVITTSGGLGEAETSGVVVNIIPRDGGNTFSGSLFGNGANSSMQGSNYTQALKDRGLRSPAELLKVYDFSAMGGGRIIRDRLWFYGTERDWGAHNTIPGLFLNKNAGNVNSWTYEPDLDRPAFSDILNRTHILRLTVQATPRNKISGYWAENYNCNFCLGGGFSPTESVEATSQFEFRPSRVQQATWTSPITNRLLAEAGIGTSFAVLGNGWVGGRKDGTSDPRLIRVVEQAGVIPGLAYRAPSKLTRQYVQTLTWRASLSYVPGAHNMKFGYFGGLNNPPYTEYYNNEVMAYRFSNGVPNSLTETGEPIGPDNYIEMNRSLHPTSLYAQDQWTHGRLTLQGGVRYDHVLIDYPEQRVGGTRIIPTVTVFPASTGANWHDITPRMGAAYDLFGNGKTAVKVNVGRYMEAALVAPNNDFDLNPLIRIALTTTRSWTDLNRNFIPDCDLTNPNANGECGDMANKALGTAVATRTWDPAWYTGWGNRPYNWELAASVQQQLFPRVAVSVGYFRRWFGNWYTVDNRATGVTDFTPFGATAPTDPRLPGGGGHTIAGLYDVVPAKFGIVDELATKASNYGTQIENWHGVDASINARLQQGLFLQAAVSSGRRLTDACDLRAQLPELGVPSPRQSETLVSFTPVTLNAASPTNPYCRVVEPFLTRFAGLATYLIPRVDVQVSATWQSNPGPELGANWNAPNAVVKQWLGRDLSGGKANIPIPLVRPATLYGDRINQVDFRVAKILRVGRTKTQVMVDVYNATNNDTPLTYNNTFVPGGSWLVPTSVLTARFVKFGAQFDF